MPPDVRGSNRVFPRFRETGAPARGAALGLTSLALGAALFAGPAATASADPAVTIPEAKAQIEQLQVDAEALSQDYLAVEQQVVASKAELALKQQDAQRQAQKVDALRKQVGQAALAQFQDRNVDTAAQLFLDSDTEGFLSQVSTIEKVGANQNKVLQDFQQQRASLADLQRSRQTDLAALQKKESDLAALKAGSDTKLAQAKVVLDQLTTAQREAIAKANKKAEEDARKLAESALGTAAEASSGSSKSHASTSSSTKSRSAKAGSAKQSSSKSQASASRSGKGQVALAWARQQLGKPYRFGATGPGAFDCSGLTLGAWRAAGVSLNRTSGAQIQNGRSVSRSELQPGDLVFFYSPISHVALYVGNGTIIHAPHPGATVEYAQLSDMPFAGARRPA